MKRRNRIPGQIFVPLLFLFCLLILMVPLTTGLTAEAAPDQQSTLSNPLSTAAQVGNTYNVTSTSCNGEGSILWAIQEANAHPGPDTIVIASDLQIDMRDCFYTPPQS